MQNESIRRHCVFAENVGIFRFPHRNHVDANTRRYRGVSGFGYRLDAGVYAVR